MWHSGAGCSNIDFLGRICEAQPQGRRQGKRGGLPRLAGKEDRTGKGRLSVLVLRRERRFAGGPYSERWG